MKHAREESNDDSSMEKNITADVAVPVWGGIECTVNRLGDRYDNQLARNGHMHRLDDLELIADLGIKTLRYPVIWETIAPQNLEDLDWSWTDSRLTKLRELGITPIVSLLHHGSGPCYTSLLDPEFPNKFTIFAKAVARRYPWLEFFTPINEPLTTARFSGLYGHWYPHARHMYSFARALINQCKATVLGMEAIRKIIPTAKLVQTEDLGKCHGTSKLQYQWEMENERRWCSLDILTGRAKENKFIDRFFRTFPKMPDELLFLSDNFCSPDIIGINHYITSERYLDHRFNKYPAWSHGSNGVDLYADIDIVRANIHQRAGHYILLKEASERLGRPVALTEVHMGSTRDEQMRWFTEAWEAVLKLKREGTDVRGITAWSMFGAYDWNSLLTQHNNFYETGIFDVSSGKPRPTALADLIKQLCSGQKPQHPVLEAQGWWKNPGLVNFMFGTKQEERQLTTVEDVSFGLPSPTPRPIIIAGATGVLGQAFARICKIRNLSHVVLSRKDMDIADAESVSQAFDKYKPWAVVNAAGFVNIDEAQTHPEVCFRENTAGAVLLASACKKYEAAFVTFSSDQVFNGVTQFPYLESDHAQPLNVYGVSKFLAEAHVLSAYPSSIIIRTSSFFGPWDRYNFLARMVQAIEQGDKFSATSDFVISPTYVPDLVNACLDLIIDKEQGIWHITNPSAVSWMHFALLTAEIAKFNTRLIRNVKPQKLGYMAPRPRYSALKSEKGLLMPALDSAIQRFLTERTKE
jgi:dTDP-4-dehydrorhamnose reductase